MLLLDGRSSWMKGAMLLGAFIASLVQPHRGGGGARARADGRRRRHVTGRCAGGATRERKILNKLFRIFFVPCFTSLAPAWRPPL